MSKHEKMKSFTVLRTLTKKINMLPMCNNEKGICKSCDAQKNDVNFFVLHKNDCFLTRGYIFDVM